MEISDYLRATQNQHSIKECVVTLFLAAPIFKPSKFKKLIDDSDFRNKFTKFEPIFNYVFQLDPANARMTPSTPNEIGFQFQGFKNGDVDFLLRGMNEGTRQYLSFHALQYERWLPFYSHFKATMSTLAGFTDSLVVNAFSLHYIDDFDWVSEDRIDPRRIFNANARVLSNSFFDAKQASTSLIVEENEPDALTERYDILFSRNQNPNIRIAHNITCFLDEICELKELLDMNNLASFEHRLNAAHIRNKDSLKNLLTREVCQLINLT